MTVNDVLKAARELISDPARWTQYAAARDKDLNPVDVTSPEAVKFCAAGAIGRVVAVNKPSTGLDFAAIDQLRAHATTAICTINDKQGYAAILALFDQAINANEAVD